jgi:hypothetical protein
MGGFATGARSTLRIKNRIPFVERHVEGDSQVRVLGASSGGAVSLATKRRTELAAILVAWTWREYDAAMSTRLVVTPGFSLSSDAALTLC